MPLNDLNKELYRQNSDAISNRSHEQSEYDPRVVGATQASPFQQEEHWQGVQKGFSPSQKKKIWISVSILAFILLAVGGAVFYAWWQKNAFHQDRVSVSFEGPKEADSTAPMKYVIHFKNDNYVSIKNAELNLSYSENFQPTDNVNLKYLSPSSSKIFIGDVKAKGEGTAELKGVFYAPKDSPVYIKASLDFIPSNGTEKLSMQGLIGVNITAAPLMLEVQAPQHAVDEDSLEYVIDYRNVDTRRMSDVQIRVEFPQGFQLGSANPKPSEKDSYWYIGNIEPDQGGKIRVQGKIRGIDQEGKDIVVSIGHVGNDGQFVVFNKQQLSTRIVSPILMVKQKLDGQDSDVIKPGDILKYTITYQNTGTIGLRDAIITAEIKGKILDFSKISIDKGSYDESKGMMTWKASDVPGLANINPKAGGEVHFSIPVKTIIPIENKLDKNFTVSSVAKIDSPDIPTQLNENKIIGSNRLELKLASKVLFETRGYYNDSKLKNSGPIPMETGKETTFTIHWSVINISNDISEAKVISSLPSGIRWIGQVYPSNEKISYNSRTNQIIWDAGNVPAGAGAIDPPREIAFQVGVTPQINQVGGPVLLVNKSIFTAKDDFVGQDITIEGNQKDTQLSEDSGVGYLNGKVAK